MRLGSDPELLLVDSAGKFVSVIGKVGGTKQQPLQILDLPTGYTVQEDNVALELGIPPCSSAAEYVHALRTCINRALTFVPGLHVSEESAALFPEEELEHPLASVFGCEPDFNAWTGKENTKPQCPDWTLRTAGGHIHVETDLPKEQVIRAMDFYLGVPSVLMDKGDLRKKLYGKAGAYRPKSYGAEYRVLSNFWVQKDNLIEWAWRNTERALELVKSGDAGNYWATCAETIQETINNNEKATAKMLCDKFDLEVV